VTMQLNLNCAVPIPCGHTVEITRFAAPATARPKFGPDTNAMVLDLDTGIRYANHDHMSRAGNGGGAYVANQYPPAPRADIQVDGIQRARVVTCTLVFVEGLGTQHTVLVLEPLTD
jgi:hypothetical protein